jgi:Transferase family
MSTTIRVKPSRKNALDLPPPVPLSIFDSIVPPLYVPIFLIFRPSTITPTSNQFTALSLISALADVLEHFPPFAGSIKPDQSGKLWVHSDSRGADFVYEFRNEQLPSVHVQDINPRGIFPDPSNKDETLLAVKLTSVRLSTLCNDSSD